MEDSAFEQIAVRLRRRAMASAARCGLSEADAEDIAQDVMLRLWQMRADLDRFSSPDALAALIARRQVINVMRRNRPVSLVDKLPDTIASAANPSADLETKQDEEWLDDRLNHMPETWHTILYMRQVEHRGSAEIAALLGLKDTSVRTLLAKARRTLLEEMRKRR